MVIVSLEAGPMPLRGEANGKLLWRAVGGTARAPPPFPLLEGCVARLVLQPQGELVSMPLRRTNHRGSG